VLFVEKEYILKGNSTKGELYEKSTIPRGDDTCDDIKFRPKAQEESPSATEAHERVCR